MPSPHRDAAEPPIVTLNPFGAFMAAALLGALATGALMALWAGMMRRAAPGGLTINFPFGSGFTQNVHPSTNWGVMGYSPLPAAEREILDRAGSYGRQIGRMMDVVVDLARKTPDADRKKREALEEIASQIARIKREYGLE
jgi:hypothetical protein